MKKTKLFIEYDYDFDLFGLISAVKEYKLAWLLNNLIDVHLIKQKDIEINFLKNKISISNYLCNTENSQFRLIKNKDTNQDQNLFLVPELKQFDYLIMLQDKGGTFEIENVTAKLKSIDDIQYITKVDYKQLKSRENLLFQ